MRRIKTHIHIPLSLLCIIFIPFLLTGNDNSASQPNADLSLTIACETDVTLFLDAFGNGNLIPADLVAFISSSCEITDTLLSQSSFDCSDVGIVTVLTTVYNACGEFNVCPTNVHVVDNSTPVAVCHAFATLSLDNNGEAHLDPESLDAGSIDNCDLSFSMDRTVFTCDDIGTFDVLLYVSDGSSETNACWTTLTVRDHMPPVVACYDVTISLGENGETSLSDHISELQEVLAENCGTVAYYWEPMSFDCSQAGESFFIPIEFEDASGNLSECTAVAHIAGYESDRDCDSVSDPCDICLSGDDRVDANGDGIPDCIQQLALSQYDPSWLCGTDRIFACKLKASGAQTKCIKENKIADFLGAGDHIGPCIECADTSPALGQIPQNGQFTGAHTTFEAYPNPLPRGQNLKVKYAQNITMSNQLTIYSTGGVKIYSQDIPADIRESKINIPLPDITAGVYFLVLENQTETISQVLIIE